jgi:hypothetical protein
MSPLTPILITVLLAFMAGEPLAETVLGAEPERTAADHASNEHVSAEHDFHVNHFGGFAGASTHMDSKDTAFSLGLEYARQFSRQWAAVAYAEHASSSNERDFILAVGGIFYPIARVGLIVAPGVEQVSKTVEHNGKVDEETEIELLLRFGVAYLFPLNAQASIGPTVFADWGSEQWTLVYGLGMVVGF